MRRDHLNRNMERYEQENEDNVSTNGQKISCKSVTDEELERRVSAQMKVFNREYKLVYEYNLNVYAWSDDMMEALEIYKYHGMY